MCQMMVKSGAVTLEKGQSLEKYINVTAEKMNNLEFCWKWGSFMFIKLLLLFINFKR